MADTEPVNVTDEMRQAVRREECELGGHHFDVVLSAGVPTKLLCTRCGDAWGVSG